MGISNRPYVGSWQLNNRQVVKYTPDALLYVNGDTTLPGCPTCGGRIDVQPYLTEISVDPSTEGPATASFSLHTPRHMGDTLFRDGNFILRPGLEVHIYIRGYFPAKGLLQGITPASTGGLDLANAVMYPYYMVFHGVMTEVQHEYSGGEHRATIQCADMLHFWQYQRVSTNGSLFGARPSGSKVKMSLVGNNFTGMSPFSIVYQLYRDVQGAAGGAEFAMGNKTNAAANSSVVGESLFSLSILYWEQRFRESMNSLRMFGVDGTLYNAGQQAFLASLNQDDIKKLAKFYVDRNMQSNGKDPLYATADLLKFDPFSLVAGASGSESDKAKGTTINVGAIQAFTSDLSQWGNVNLFESQYMTKMEVVNAVKEASGFEFYQDVDGDFVFKPPFYNLDTSSSIVYRIEDVDIISFSASEKEPEATVVKATGSFFQVKNVLEGEFGVRAEFVDYRLVAQFGWRQSTFETYYHNNPGAMFFACVARFDIFNIGVKSATCTIPIRSEMRPGLPVYIVPYDCFYYVHSMGHSFSFGGSCTTTLNLVGKRAKFYAPGNPSGDGTKATIKSIDLSQMQLPALPLEVIGNDGIPRLQGFPNVVMTIDPELVNPLSFATGVAINDLNSEASIQNLLNQALAANLSIVQFDPLNSVYSIQTGNETNPYNITPAGLLGLVPKVQQVSDLEGKAKNDKEIEQLNTLKAEVAPLLAVVAAVQDIHAQKFPDSQSSAAYLELLGDKKAQYNPGKSLPGYYRYYSSAHPEAAMQGPRALNLNKETGEPSAGDVSIVDETKAGTIFGFTDVDSGVVFGDVTVLSGLPILQPDGKTTKVTPSHDITTFTIAAFDVIIEGTRYVSVGTRAGGFPTGPLQEDYRVYFLAKLRQFVVSQTRVLSELEPLYNTVADQVEKAAFVSGTTVNLSLENPSDTGEQPTTQFDSIPFPYVSGTTQNDIPGEGSEQYESIATTFARTIASAASQALKAQQEKNDGDPDLTDEAKKDASEIIARSWAQCWIGANPVQSKGANQRKSDPVDKDNRHEVPVFPVSDERGYEVVGTYRYGRGISIDAGGNLGDIAFRERLTSDDYSNIETVVLDLKKGGLGADVSHALGALAKNTEQGAQLAAAVSAATVTDTRSVDGSNQGSDQIAAGNKNRSADSRESTQKIAVNNAAYSLADLGSTNPQSVCSCRGAEADILLQAFNIDLQVGIEDTERVQEWLSDQMVQTGIEWAATQSAYRGTVTEQSASSISAAQDLAKRYSDIFGKGE